MVIYMCGCNDLYRGESPNRTVNGFMKFVDKLHAHLSDTQIIYVSIINSPLMVPPSPTPCNPALSIFPSTWVFLAWRAAGEGRVEVDAGAHDSTHRVRGCSDPRLWPRLRSPAGGSPAKP